MGQAKQRGSYEERVQQAQERIAVEREAIRLREQERRAKLQAEFDALPEEEKNKIRKEQALRSKRRPLGAWGAFALLAGLSSFR